MVAHDSAVVRRRGVINNVLIYFNNQYNVMNRYYGNKVCRWLPNSFVEPGSSEIISL